MNQQLRRLSDKPLVGDIRGDGLVYCLEYVANKATKELLPDEIDIGKRIANAAEALGLMVRPLAHLNVMSPALIIKNNQIDFIVDSLEKAMDKVTDELIKEGIKVTG